MNIDIMLDRAAAWLLKQQDPNTGGWPPYRGGPISTLNTAEVIVALLDMNQPEYACNNPKITKALDFLERSQCCEGKNKGAWLRSIPRTNNEVSPIPDIIRTSFAVQALIRSYRGNNPATLSGLNWLIKVRNNEDNGWGYRENDPASIMPTCFALLALNDATSNRIRDFTEIIESGIRCLITFRKDSGSFCTSQDKADCLEAIHTVYVILTLQALRHSKTRTYDKEEEGALRWLHNNPESALKIIEDRIFIDGPEGEGSYNFLYMANTFVLQVMLKSKQEDYKNLGKNILAKKSLNGLMSSWNIETGSFYSPRPVTWATAKAITSLKACKGVIENIPPETSSTLPPPTKDPRKVGRDILLFLSVIVAAVVGLTIYGLFTWLNASFFVIMALVALAGYDVISDKTLSNSLKLFFKSWK